jgi:hypothetical protein
MLSVFNYSTPAAVTETPTGITTENFKFDREQTYASEWADLFGSCCLQGKLIPGIVLLMLLYSNNLTEGNFYYGGMNASVMLLRPDIFEFRDILKDLETYSPERLKFFYPEQQYLTLRYAFGSSLTPERISEIIGD